MQNIVDEFVETMGHIGAGIGLSKVACQLYALLFIKGEPLSLSQMAEELKVSKGNVSVNIRALESWGAVRKVWKKGSRRDFYQCEEDIPRIVITRLREGLGKRLATIKEFIERAKSTSNGKQIQKLEELILKAEEILKFLKEENIRLFFPKGEK
ncbi:MAG TPA: MarR family transcriptional regulator [Candidatus Omnitrophica bacterium]|nr:MarR family transcriptional regulator [Candidatus Omnitrophota bacterium]